MSFAKAATTVARAGARSASTISVDKASSSFLRSMGPLGKALNARPNTVQSSQTQYTTAKHADTFLNGAKDKVWVGGTLLFTGVTLLYTLLGAADMVLGTNKKPAA